MSNINHFLGNTNFGESSFSDFNSSNTSNNTNSNSNNQFPSSWSNQQIQNGVGLDGYSSASMQQSKSFAGNNYDFYGNQLSSSNTGSSIPTLSSLINHASSTSPQFQALSNGIPNLSSLNHQTLLVNHTGTTTPNSLLPLSRPITPNSLNQLQSSMTPLYQQQSQQSQQSQQQNQQQQSTPSSSNGSNPTGSRTVYLGNIPTGITSNELLNHVRSGTVESLKLIPSKNCAFISFLDEKSATLFHSDATLKRLSIGNRDVKIGWGKASPVPPIVLSSIQKFNATRNVYLGNLPDFISEEELKSDVLEYGDIDTIKILPERKIAFIHFTSILAAVRCVQSLPLVDKYKDRKIFYGKDRCAFITKTQQHNAAQYLGLNPNSENFLNNIDKDLIASALVQQSNAAAMIATSTGGSTNLGNRTVYLGSLHPDSTVEEICNVVRGGILQNVRLINERHVCFITFIDPISAAQFYAMSSLHGLIIHNRNIKIGWGKHSGPLPNLINLAVGNGASRNIYIGGLDKIPEIHFTKDKLYNDFREFGDIEQINFFQERNCCFVNFTNISNAIKAIDGIRNNPDYSKCKVNFGKDRCGNTPRQFQLNNNNTIATNPSLNESPQQSQDQVTENHSTSFYDYSSDEDEEDFIDESQIMFNPLGIQFSINSVQM